MREVRTGRRWARRALRYEPYFALGGRPHVLVDGAPASGTVLTLSHWPGTPTPGSLRADLSVESALAWWASPGHPAAADVATTDHLDQDGLAGLWALVSPEEAAQRRARLIEVARAGDFTTFADRGGARASFALAQLADPERSSLPSATLADQGALTTELLGRMGEILDRPARDLWVEEEMALVASEADIASGRISLEDVPAVDLAVVSLPPGAPSRLTTQFMVRREAACHPAAVHNLTGATRVLYFREAHFELEVRYESWVRLVSRSVAPRVDLAPLAAALQAEEPQSAARWSADPVSSLVQRLTGPETSSLSPARVRRLVIEHLRRAPPAWFPANEGRPSAAPHR